MENPKKQLIDRLKESTNVLVTVSTNPSVDQLASAIGFSLMLNSLEKHATAVFSGEAPSTLEFLKPEETLAKNTDALRDFIISLDKAKADKLRYKVEDKMVKIFITPYRTALSQDDLVFSQGDFNVDVVVALGVHNKDDIDQAIIAHGRILHDATVVSINNKDAGELGSINWTDTKASSLSEMLVGVCQELKPDSLDEQMATAFLTGIVAETDRFSNEKTSSITMNTSAKLMAAGANQQLVANKLEQPAPLPPQPASEQPAPTQGQQSQPEQPAPPEDGALQVEHEPEEKPEEAPGSSEEQTQQPAQVAPQEAPAPAEPRSDEKPLTESPQEQKPEDNTSSRHLMMEPPSRGGTLTSSTTPEAESYDPSTDPLSLPPVNNDQILSRDKQPSASSEEQTQQPEPEAPEATPAPTEPKSDEKISKPSEQTQDSEESSSEEKPTESTESVDPHTEIQDTQSLSDLEKSVNSPHVQQEENKPPNQPVPTPEQASSPDDAPKPQSTPDADAAREAIEKAMREATESPDQPQQPIEALNAQPVDLGEVNEEASAPEPKQPELQQMPGGPSSNISVDPNTGELTFTHDDDEEPATPPTSPQPPEQADSSNSDNDNSDDPNAPPPVPPPMMPPFNQ